MIAMCSLGFITLLHVKGKGPGFWPSPLEFFLQKVLLFGGSIVGQEIVISFSAV